MLLCVYEIVIGRFVVSYCVCRAFMYTIYISYMYVKCSRYRPGVAQKVGRGTALLFHDCGTRRGWVVSSMPRPHFTPRKTQHPFNRRVGGPQGWSGWVENLVPTGIRSRTIQPIFSHYTEWGATRSTHPSVITCNYDTKGFKSLLYMNFSANIMAVLSIIYSTHEYINLNYLSDKSSLYHL